MVILLVDMDILNTAPLDLGGVEARRRQLMAEVREEIGRVNMHNRLLSIKLVGQQAPIQKVLITTPVITTVQAH